jgi:hypothetical protein
MIVMTARNISTFVMPAAIVVVLLVSIKPTTIGWIDKGKSYCLSIITWSLLHYLRN